MTHTSLLKKIRPLSGDIFPWMQEFVESRFDFASTEISFSVKEQAMDLSRRKPR